MKAKYFIKEQERENNRIDLSNLIILIFKRKQTGEKKANQKERKQIGKNMAGCTYVAKFQIEIFIQKEKNGWFKKKEECLISNSIIFGPLCTFKCFKSFNFVVM